MYYSNKLINSSNVQYDEETIPVFARWFGSWRISLQRRALSSPQLTRFYDLAAPGWSQKLDRLGFPDAYETLLRRVLSEEAPGVTGAQLRVLDCGVGTGALSCALARVLPAPFKLDAIDISPRMLERASSSLRDTNLEVSLRHGDVRNLPYGNGVFDLVMTAHVLEHLVDPSVALSEMVRVLKPGGSAHRVPHPPLPPGDIRASYVANASGDTRPGRKLVARKWFGKRPLPVVRPPRILPTAESGMCRQKTAVKNSYETWGHDLSQISGEEHESVQ